MKNIAHITGSSSGIGKAIAEILLERGWRVFGYSRRQTIHHSRYSHRSVDLSIPEAAGDIDFSKELKDAQKVVLINNAGQTDPVKRLGALPEPELIKGIHLNLTAPIILMNSFLKIPTRPEMERIIINVSTGAAKIR
ncbi:MAG: SDR family NAD(P)-dependent oxidoreductase [Bacteroidia bacterium]